MSFIAEGAVMPLRSTCDFQGGGVPQPRYFPSFSSFHRYLFLCSAIVIKISFSLHFAM